jgi:Ca2+-binding RTX toxin-like protein
MANYTFNRFQAYSGVGIGTPQNDSLRIYGILNPAFIPPSFNPDDSLVQNTLTRLGVGDDSLSITHRTMLNNRFYTETGNDAVRITMFDTGSSAFNAVFNNNAIYTGNGHDRILAVGEGNNILSGNTIDAGFGNDRLSVRNHTLGTFIGGGGNDYMKFVDVSNSTILAQSGDDAVRITNGTVGEVRLGDGLNNILATSTDRFSIFGGINADAYSFYEATGLRIEDTLGDDTFKLIDVEGVVLAGEGNDTITVLNGTDLVVNAGLGNDRIAIDGNTTGRFYGAEGDDSIRVDMGKHAVEDLIVSGGVGNDRILYENASVVASMEWGTLLGPVALSGGSGNDTIKVDLDFKADLDNYPTGTGIVNESIYTPFTGDIYGATIEVDADVFGGSGDDTLFFSAQHEQVIDQITDVEQVAIYEPYYYYQPVYDEYGEYLYDEEIYGGEQFVGYENEYYTYETDVTPYVDASATTLWGGSGDDRLTLEYGNAATLNGGNGNDTLISLFSGAFMVGGAGNDLYKGGLGNDNFIFGANDGNDIVQDTQGYNTVSFIEGIQQDDVAVWYDTATNKTWFQYEDDSTVSLNTVGGVASTLSAVVYADGQAISSGTLNTITAAVQQYITDNGLVVDDVSDVYNNADLMNLIAAAA